MDAETIFRSAFFGLLAALLLVRGYFGLRVRASGERMMPDERAIEREGRWLFAVRLASFFGLVAVLGLYAWNPDWLDTLALPFAEWLRWTGVALGVLSIAGLAWVQATLGRQFSAQLQIRKGHELITVGPYSHIRHPLYTAIIGIGLAFALVTANWLFVVMAVWIAVGLALRIPKEERMLIDEFGERYLEYRRHTGGLIPR